MYWSIIRFVLIGGVCLYLIVSIFESVFNLRGAEYKINSAESELTRVSYKKSELEGDLNVSESEFVEKEARNKLNMVRPGEMVVLLPEVVPTVVEKEQENQVVIRRDWWRWILGGK